MMLLKCCGQIYLERKDFKKVIEVYTNAVKYNSENHEIYYILGICYARINDFSIAKKCFEKTVELDEENYNAYYRLGQIALLYRDFDVAETNFAKSLYNEKEAKSYFELAKINIMKNQKEKAIMNLNNAIKVDSNYYNIIQKEPIFFSIKQLMQKPTIEVAREYDETDLEKETEEYLNDTYNLTKILNGKKENKNIITKKKQT